MSWCVPSSPTLSTYRLSLRGKEDTRTTKESAGCRLCDFPQEVASPQEVWCGGFQHHKLPICVIAQSPSPVFVTVQISGTEPPASHRGEKRAAKDRRQPLLLVHSLYGSKTIAVPFSGTPRKLNCKLHSSYTAMDLGGARPPELMYVGPTGVWTCPGTLTILHHLWVK